MAAFLTDGREIIVSLLFFSGHPHTQGKQRNDWMVLDNQFFTFNDLSMFYSVTDLMRIS